MAPPDPEIQVQEEAAPAAAQPAVCEVCNEAKSKYRCPRCDHRTCSLACIKRHKTETNCSGERDRLAYVSMKEFDDRTLLSDFRLLEDVQRAEDVARRHRPMGSRPQLPPALASLVYQAQRRGVRLLLMPPGLHKRKANTTRYVNRNFKMMWRVEWHFPSASPSSSSTPIATTPSSASLPLAASTACAPATAASSAATAASAVPPASTVVPVGAPPAVNGTVTASAAAVSAPGSARSAATSPTSISGTSGLTVADEKVSEDSTLISLLQPHLQYSAGNSAQLLALRQYVDAGVAGLTLLLRQEGCPANNIHYYSLDPSTTLATALAYKTIVEYPVITVLLPHEVRNYKLVEPPPHPPPPTQQQEWARTQAFRAHIAAQALIAKNKAKAAAEAAATLDVPATATLPGPPSQTDNCSNTSAGMLPGPPARQTGRISAAEVGAVAGASGACSEHAAAACAAGGTTPAAATVQVNGARQPSTDHGQPSVATCSVQAKPSVQASSHPRPETAASLPPAKRHQSMTAGGTAPVVPPISAESDVSEQSRDATAVPDAVSVRTDIALGPDSAQQPGLVCAIDANEIEI